MLLQRNEANVLSILSFLFHQEEKKCAVCSSFLQEKPTPSHFVYIRSRCSKVLCLCFFLEYVLLRFSPYMFLRARARRESPSREIIPRFAFLGMGKDICRVERVKFG